MSEIIWCDNDTAAPVGGNPTPTGANRPGALWATNHALWVTQGANIGQPNSAVNGYSRGVTFGGAAQHAISGTSAVNLSGVTIGTAGTIGDTFVGGILVTAACTVTLTGFFQDQTAANQNLAYVFAAAGYLWLPQMINLYGPATVTCTVTETAFIWHGVP